MIFSNYKAEETVRLQSTIRIEQTEVKVLNHIVRISDAGGQHNFLQSYRDLHPQQTYGDLAAFIGVIDFTSDSWKADIEDLSKHLELCLRYSQQSKVFIMIHKIDCIDPEFKFKDNSFRNIHVNFKLTPEQKQELNQAQESIHKMLKDQLLDRNIELKQIDQIHYSQATICNESIFSAWGNVLHSILETIQEFDIASQQFCKDVQADEVIIFEKKTLLPLVNYSEFTKYPNVDPLKKRSDFVTQKVKDIMTFSKDQYSGTNQNQSLNFSLKTNHFQIFFRRFTPNTYILVAYYMTSDRIRQGNCYSEIDRKDSSKTNYMGITPSMIDSCIDQLKEQLKDKDQMYPTGRRFR